MKQHEQRLHARADQGVYWWELRSCAYYDVFDKPKIIWQDLGYHSRFALCESSFVSEATCFSLACDDTWLLAVLNSPLLWWWLWRNTIHGKDEVLRLKNIYTERIPVAQPSQIVRERVGAFVARLVEITRTQQTSRRQILDWLRVEHEVEKPTMKLQSPMGLDSDGFVVEVAKARGKKTPLSAAALANLREEYARSITPARILATEALTLESEVSGLVNEAYGLTPEEIDLMWQTAPPRMPITGPK